MVARPPTDPMKAAWRRETQRALAWLLTGLAVGWLLDAEAAGLLVGGMAYLLRHLRMLYRLAMWSTQPKRHPLPDAGGVWGAVFDRLLDLQQRNDRRKKQLASIVAQFQASTAALPDGAVVLTPRGEIAWFNEAAQSFLGLRSPQDLGQRIANLVRHPRFTRYLYGAKFDDDVEVPSPVNAQNRLSLRIVPYGQGQRLLIVRDVSNQRRLEMMRRDFVANASHELRTPLTVLRGYLDMILQDPQATGLGHWQGPLDEMRTQSSRMDALVNDLLKLARLEAEPIDGRQVVIDMPALLQHALDSSSSLSRDQHEITAEIDSSLFLYGIELEIDSVVANLLSNAVRYTPAGGAITLRWFHDVGGAVLAVADTGIGIEQSHLPRLTDRFYRVDVGRSRASGGTGLGLAIVKHVLQRHEARLEVYSRPGEGSTFACRFPLHRVRGPGASAVNA